MKDFAGKVAVVTGAASGMGKAFIMDFARRGMHVVLADIEAGPLEAARQEAEALGAKAIAQVCDVSKREAVQALADKAFDAFGAVHVLCNNAGVSIEGQMHEHLHKEWEWVLGVNLWGVIHGIEAFLPRMVAQNKVSQKPGGHVVNTASIAGLHAAGGTGIYNTSKFAVVGLSETMWRDLRDTGIGVSVLCPLGVHTGIFESARNQPGDIGRAITDINPRTAGSGTWLTPEQVSGMVMDAIEQERLYILTHPETEGILEKRFARIRNGYPKTT
jgi:NAD(P)-dependent dehydrogenase (short-subunit alcohol dehydrogenase family)